MSMWVHRAIGFAAVLLVIVSVAIEGQATTYQINDFTQEPGPIFFDPFNGVGGTPPPAGPFGPTDYSTFGTFFPGDETGGLLNLVTSQGGVEPGDDMRLIGATVGNPTYLFSFGSLGLVRGVFRNLAPAPGEGYGIIIEPIANVDDEALLLVFNSGGGPVAVFRDEGPAPLGIFPLAGMDGSGEIGLTLQMDGAGVVTALMDLDGMGDVDYFLVTTTLGTLGTETHTGGFGAFEPVPEPGTLLLLGSGLVGVATAAWRRRRH